MIAVYLFTTVLLYFLLFLGAAKSSKSPLHNLFQENNRPATNIKDRRKAIFREVNIYDPRSIDRAIIKLKDCRDQEGNDLLLDLISSQKICIENRINYSRFSKVQCGVWSAPVTKVSASHSSDTMNTMISNSIAVPLRLKLSVVAVNDKLKNAVRKIVGRELGLLQGIEIVESEYDWELRILAVERLIDNYSEVLVLSYAMINRMQFAQLNPIDHQNERLNNNKLDLEPKFLVTVGPKHHILALGGQCFELFDDEFVKNRR